jgi:hypothetical protein
MNCADKFLKHSERVGARFAEQNAGTQQVRRRVFRADDEALCRSDECCSTKIERTSIYACIYLVPLNAPLHHAEYPACSPVKRWYEQTFTPSLVDQFIAVIVIAA